MGAPQQAFSRNENGKCYTLALLAANALPGKHREKTEATFSLRPLHFTGFADALYGTLHDNKLFFVHAVQYPINFTIPQSITQP